jgi:hypothetical protein
MRTPPRSALFLLDRLGVNNAVSGDLSEEFTAGHSSVWFWRQVMWTVAVETWRETRRHPILTARVLLVGWGMLAVLHRTGMWLALRLGPTETRWMPWAYPPRMGFVVVNEGLWSICLLAVSATAAAGAGFIVARTHHHVRTASLVFGLSVVATVIYFGGLILLASPNDRRMLMALGLAVTVIIATVGGGLLGGRGNNEGPPLTSAERGGSSARRR